MSQERQLDEGVFFHFDIIRYIIVISETVLK